MSIVLLNFSNYVEANNCEGLSAFKCTPDVYPTGCYYNFKIRECVPRK